MLLQLREYTNDKIQTKTQTTKTAFSDGKEDVVFCVLGADCKILLNVYFP